MGIATQVKIVQKPGKGGTKFVSQAEEIEPCQEKLEGELAPHGADYSGSLRRAQRLQAELQAWKKQ